jgi:hypothetical protein
MWALISPHCFKGVLEINGFVGSLSLKHDYGQNTLIINVVDVSSAMYQGYHIKQAPSWTLYDYHFVIITNSYPYTRLIS